jgi:ribosomal protein L6P/L9E
MTLQFTSQLKVTYIHFPFAARQIDQEIEFQLLERIIMAVQLIGVFRCIN